MLAHFAAAGVQLLIETHSDHVLNGARLAVRDQMLPHEQIQLLFFGGAREPAPYVLEFSRWIEDALVRGDLKALLNYRSQAPHAARAHPTDDHFLPFFFALGAAGDDLRANYLSREVMYSMLAMDAFSLHPVH